MPEYDVNVNNFEGCFSLDYSCDGALDEAPHRSRNHYTSPIPVTIEFIVYIAWIWSISFVLCNQNPIVR